MAMYPHNPIPPVLWPGATRDEFPAQGIYQGNFSRKKIFKHQTRINTGDLQSAREVAGKEQGITE